MSLTAACSCFYNFINRGFRQRNYFSSGYAYFLISRGLCTKQSREKYLSNSFVTREGLVGGEELPCPENTVVLLMKTEILY